MFRLWFVLAALVLPVSCSDTISLECKLEHTYSGFEERFCPATTWIQTKIGEDQDFIAVLAAGSVLKSYCQKLKNPDVCNTQPAVIYKDESDQFFLQWVIPAGDFGLSNETDPDVKVITRTSLTLYARTFEGTPSLESGKLSADFLKADLDKAEKSYNKQSYFGACYSFCTRKEIWIFAE